MEPEQQPDDDGLTRDQPNRVVLARDAVGWLEEQKVLDGSIVTGLPDWSEVKPQMTLPEYKAWLTRVACLIVSKLAVDSPQVAIFYQTDIKILNKRTHECNEWLDKAYYVQKGAEEAGSRLLFHKILLCADVETIKWGRPTFSHLLCFTRSPNFAYDLRKIGKFADVSARGEMTWERATGLGGALRACEFIRDCVGAQTVIDPFCGKGTVLATANYCGLKAMGCEISPKRARQAMRLPGSSLFDGEGNQVWQEVHDKTAAHYLRKKGMEVPPPKREGKAALQAWKKARKEPKPEEDGGQPPAAQEQEGQPEGQDGQNPDLVWA